LLFANVAVILAKVHAVFGPRFVVIFADKKRFTFVIQKNTWRRSRMARTSWKVAHRRGENMRREIDGGREGSRGRGSIRRKGPSWKIVTCFAVVICFAASIRRHISPATCCKQ
jgi:hypothetical protein